MWVCLALYVLAFVVASFAREVGVLIVFQGILAGSAGGLLYAPIYLYVRLRERDGWTGNPLTFCTTAFGVVLGQTSISWGDDLRRSRPWRVSLPSRAEPRESAHYSLSRPQLRIPSHSQRFATASRLSMDASNICCSLARRLRCGHPRYPTSLAHSRTESS